MIFVTVGTQLPFERLLSAMDAIAANSREDFIAQTGAGQDNWTHLRSEPHLSPDAFAEFFRAARVVVAHAGIGSILSAKRFGKPLIILPRRAALGEHRNDHQMATARQVESIPGIHVAWEAEDIEAFLSTPDLTCASEGASPARAALIARLSDFIKTS